MVTLGISSFCVLYTTILFMHLRVNFCFVQQLQPVNSYFLPSLAELLVLSCRPVAWKVTPSFHLCLWFLLPKRGTSPFVFIKSQLLAFDRSSNLSKSFWIPTLCSRACNPSSLISSADFFISLFSMPLWKSLIMIINGAMAWVDLCKTPLDIPSQFDGKLLLTTVWLWFSTSCAPHLFSGSPRR